MHFCRSQFYYTQVLLFHGFYIISENCYCSQALYTAGVINPCAAKQEGYCTFVKVGKSHNQTHRVA